jgi:ABC-type transporter Mla MlaB component
VWPVQSSGTEERDPYAALYPEVHRLDLAGSRARDMNTRLVLEDQLDVNARIEFSMRASELVRHADGQLGVDCSAIHQIDEPLIGLLTWLTRNARQRGLVVVLEGATPALLAGLERAGVLDRFVCQSVTSPPSA